MSTSINARVSLDVLFNEIITGGLKAGTLPTQWTEALDLANGTSDGQINKAWAKRESSIGATTTTYDLVGGSLADTEGNAVTFDEVVLLAVKNRGTTATQYLTVGPDATNGFGVLASNVGWWAAAIGSGGGTIVPADGYSWTIWHCRGGIPAAAGSTDELSVVTTGTGNGWDVIILGRDNP